MQTKKELGFVPMFGKLAIISGCDGARQPQYAIALESIHNKLSQKVE
ncbi:hypothetical protein [Nostoc sp.]